MSKLGCKLTYQALKLDMCHPYAKHGLGALISSLWKRYLMSEARFENDD
jgi:hypothetical protein